MVPATVRTEESQRRPRFRPRLLEVLRDGQAKKNLVSDLIAGVTVGLVALPLAMAFGIASGTTPQAGIYTAIVAGGLISALGGSLVQIGGPTGAFIVIVAGIIAKFGFSGLLIATLMAGILLVIMGVTGLGRAIQFIPRPVTIGFTNGIALIIALPQIKDFLGLTTPKLPYEFLPKMAGILSSLSTINWAAFGVGAASLATVIFWPRLTKRVPGTIVALLLATTAVAVFHLPVATIGTLYGGVPQGLPPIHLPPLDLAQIPLLLPAAITIALLAAIESLLSAVVADNMTGDRHNPDTELIAQGVANIASPFFGGIPATGAIARTATNIRSGAKTPIAGITHAITLLLIVLVAAPLAKYVPMATLAAVLFVVAYNMGEWREIKTILSLSKADISVWAVTFFLTVVADLTIAVEVGMILAALLYISRVSQTTTVEAVTDEYVESGMSHVLQGKDIPPYAAVLRIHGPFLFGTTEKLTDATANLNDFPEIVVLRLRNMTALDGTGLHAIESLADRLRASGRTLLLCGAREQPARLITRSRELAEHVGAENILPHVEAALNRARDVHTKQAGEPVAVGKR